jgi:N-acetylglutamate synthase-like GNAT family acetyltransferase
VRGPKNAGAGRSDIGAAGDFDSPSAKCYNAVSMQVRKAEKMDMPGILALAGTLSLDHPGMERDDFWVGVERGDIIGIVCLKKHPDCLELCSLGVNPRFRDRGVGASLVEALLTATPSDVYLATAIPGFFEKLGFIRTSTVPRSLSDRQGTAWCEGCDRESCTIMVGRSS